MLHSIFVAILALGPTSPHLMDYSISIALSRQGAGTSCSDVDGFFL
jgi:hypothetical protein